MSSSSRNATHSRAPPQCPRSRLSDPARGRVPDHAESRLHELLERAAVASVDPSSTTITSSSTASCPSADGSAEVESTGQRSFVGITTVASTEGMLLHGMHAPRPPPGKRARLSPVGVLCIER